MNGWSIGVANVLLQGVEAAAVGSAAVVATAPVVIAVVGYIGSRGCSKTYQGLK